jgi:hypothetical protein
MDLDLCENIPKIVFSIECCILILSKGDNNNGFSVTLWIILRRVKIIFGIG